MQNNSVRYIIIVSIIFLAAIGCSLPSLQDNPYDFPNLDSEQESNPADTQPQAPDPIITNTNPPAPTSTSTVAATASPTQTEAIAPTATIENHYYFNNFDSETQGELFSNHEEIEPRYENGQLVIQVKSTSNLLYHLTMYDEDLLNAHINAQVVIEGNSSSGAGLFCRLTENSQGPSFYAFIINKNGDFVIQYRTTTEDGSSNPEETLVQGKTDLLDPPNRLMNQIHAVCQGDKMYFFLNGELLAETKTNRPLTPGRYGLIVWNSQGDESTTAYWDMVTITTP